MTIHAADTYPDQNLEQLTGRSGPVPRMLDSIHERARARWTEEPEDLATSRKHENQRRQMLHAFYAFCEREHKFDPKSTHRSNEPAIAHAIHDFTHDAVLRRNASRPNQAATLSAERVTSAIDQHYATFKLARNAKTNMKLVAEVEAIDKMKRKVYATEYTEVPSFDGGEPALIGEKRLARYPEIGLTLELRQALHEDGSALGVDSTEVVLAAFGSTFPPLKSYDVIEVRDEMGAITRKITPNWPSEEGYSMVQSVDDQAIPADYQAETYLRA